MPWPWPWPWPWGAMPNCACAARAWRADGARVACVCTRGTRSPRRVAPLEQPRCCAPRPCLPHRYNHGPQQWANSRPLGFITLPLAMFDPANDCFGRGLLSGSGAYLMGKWTVPDLLELFRGAFSLHTRSYEIKGANRPLRNESQFAVLYRFIKDKLREKLRASPHGAAVNLVPVGYRDDAAHLLWSQLTARNRPYTPPDPSYVPALPQRRVHLATLGEQHDTYYMAFESQKRNGCVRALRAAVVPLQTVNRLALTSARQSISANAAATCTGCTGAAFAAQHARALQPTGHG